MTRKPPENLEEQLRMDEGEVLHFYIDHLGFQTIGVGHLIDKRRGGGIDKETSDFIFNKDYEAFLAGAKINWPDFGGDNSKEHVYRSLKEALTPWQDDLGYFYIGRHHCIDKRIGGGIDKETSAFILQKDIKAVKAALNIKWPKFHKLDEVRQEAFANMAFQLGPSGVMNFRNTLSLVSAGKIQEASKEMLHSKWARVDTPARARRISQQVATGERV